MSVMRYEFGGKMQRYTKKFYLFVMILWIAMPWMLAPGCPIEPLKMNIVLDNQPMRDLEEKMGNACSPREDVVWLDFSAVNDPEEMIADDEMYFRLSLRIENVADIPLGEPVDLSRNASIFASASVFCFCPDPQEALTEVQGSVTFTTLTNTEAEGSLDLTFTDPDDVNQAVQRSVKFDVQFSNLSIVASCPEL